MESMVNMYDSDPPKDETWATAKRFFRGLLWITAVVSLVSRHSTRMVVFEFVEVLNDVKGHGPK
jgi:hypothetical protein